MKKDDLRSTMDTVVNRLRVLGSSGFIVEPKELVLKHGIMLFDHIENPDGVLARNARYTAKWELIADHTTRPNPRDNRFHCTFFVQEPYPNKATEKVIEDYPEDYKECLKFWKTDKRVSANGFDVDKVCVKHIMIDSHSMELRMADNPDNSYNKEFCLGKLYLPYDRVLRILAKVGVDSVTERERYVNYDYYRNDLMSRELKMYVHWKMPTGRLYRFSIVDNMTNRVLYKVDDYYPCMYAHYFDDIVAAYILGLFEQNAAKFNVVVTSDYDDFDL